MEEKRIKSFTIFREYFELISILNSRDKKDLFYAILLYMFEDKEPELNEKQKKIFLNLKRPLDASKNNAKRSLGKGAPKGNTNALKYKKSTEKKQTKNKPENVNKTMTSMMSMSMSMSNNNYDNNYYNINIKRIIDYLNTKSKSNYRSNTIKTRKLIQTRLKENYTLDDFIKVIDNKCEEWMGTEFEVYLRPETLFGNKFESYLNQKYVKRLSYQEQKRKEEEEIKRKFLEGEKND